MPIIETTSVAGLSTQGNEQEVADLFAPPTIEEIKHRLAALELLGRQAPQQSQVHSGILDLEGERSEIYGYEERECHQL